MRAPLILAIPTLIAFAALPAVGASASLDTLVKDAVLAQLNLDDDETDSLPTPPRFVTVRTPKDGEMLAVAYGSRLELFTRDAGGLAPVEGSLTRVSGRISALEALDLNGDGRTELRLATTNDGRESDSYYAVEGKNLRRIGNDGSVVADLDGDGKSELLVPVEDERADDEETPEYAVLRWTMADLRATQLVVAAKEIVTDSDSEEVFQVAVGDRGCSSKRLHVVRHRAAPDGGANEIVLSIGGEEVTRLSGEAVTAEADLDVKRPTPLRVVTKGAKQSRILVIVEEQCVDAPLPAMIIASR